MSVCVSLVTGSPPPVRAWEMEATSALPVSLATLASTVNGKISHKLLKLFHDDQNLNWIKDCH